MKKLLISLTLLTSFNLFAQTNDYLEFNGMQDGVRVSHLPIYNTITSELTVSAWFYQDASLLNNANLGTRNPVVSKHFRKPEPMSPLVFECGLWMYNGASDFQYLIGGTGGTIQGYIPSVIINDTWQHFLMSVKNDSLKLFIDGNLVESISIGSGFVFNTNPDDIEIGYRQDNPANNTYTFPGKIRDVFILNRGIEESELATHMNCGPSLADPNLLGYWVLDEGTGTTASDLSLNLNDGIHQDSLNWVSSNLVLNCCTLNPITSQPTNQSTNIGNNATFSFTDTLTGATYQWQMDAGTGYTNLSNAGQFSGTDTKTLTVSAVTMSNNNTNYRCLVTESASCMDTTDVVTLTVSEPGISINELNNSLIKLFPNPSNGIITITLSQYSNGQIILTDILGKEVLSKSFTSNEVQLNLRSLESKGTYFAKVFDSDGNVISIKKLIYQ